MAMKKFEIPLSITHANGKTEVVLCAVRANNLKDAQQAALDRGKNAYKSASLFLDDEPRHEPVKSVHQKIQDRDYDSKVPYPRREDYKTIEKFTDANGGQHEIKSYNDVKFKQDREAYRLDQARLIEEFKHDVLTDQGLSDNPKADLVYSIAWEKGHANGLSEVYIELQELAPLVRDIAPNGDLAAAAKVLIKVLDGSPVLVDFNAKEKKAWEKFCRAAGLATADS